MSERRAAYHAGPLPRTFRLPLPPAGVNHMYRSVTRLDRMGVPRARVIKSVEHENWETEAGWTVGDWRPPAHTRLSVAIRLEMTPAKLRRYDCDSMVKALIDATVGRRADNWVDRITVEKVPGFGVAEVTIARLEDAA